MSLVCGSSFILCGIVTIMLMASLHRTPSLIRVIIVIAGFLAISGMLAVYYMPDNPFAWTVLALDIGLLFAIMKLRLKNINNQAVTDDR